MSTKTRPSGFYRDDAARLVADAARKGPGPTIEGTATRVAATPEQGPSAASARREAPDPQTSRRPAGKPEAPEARREAPPIFIDEPARPPLAPEPAINQNEPAHGTALVATAAPSRRRRSPFRLAARILIAPLYIAMAIGSAFILVLAAKFFFKL